MNNFTFFNPVRIHFGKDQIQNLTKETKKYSKIMMVYGKGSIKKNGVYSQVLKALEGTKVIEFSGVEANPRYETLMKAVNLAKSEKVDFLLAVGGGSVVDGTKFIAAATNYSEGDPWDILASGGKVQSALPLGAVITLPATGSEMNSFAVITRNEKDKLPFASPKVFPQFAIIDPTTTFSLPPRQIGNGIVDAFVHVMEQYLTYDVNAPIQDSFCESILKTLIAEGPKTFNNPEDYDSRANLVLSATFALNGFISVGVPQDWATHMIGHELTAIYGIDHAQSLAIILPIMMNRKRDNKRGKILRYAKNVLGIENHSEEETIDKAIKETRAFFESVGVKTHLKDYAINKDTLDQVTKNLEKHGMVKLGEKSDVTLDTVSVILKESY